MLAGSPRTASWPPPATCAAALLGGKEVEEKVAPWDILFPPSVAAPLFLRPACQHHIFCLSSPRTQFRYLPFPFGYLSHDSHPVLVRFQLVYPSPAPLLALSHPAAKVPRQHTPRSLVCLSAASVRNPSSPSAIASSTAVLILSIALFRLYIALLLSFAEALDPFVASQTHPDQLLRNLV